MGESLEAESFLQKVLERSKSENVSQFWLAILYCALEKIDLCFEWLEKAYEDRDQWLRLLKIHHVFGTIHSDSRYQAMLKKVGLDK